MARGDRDAQAYIVAELNKYGIGTELAAQVWKMIQGGMSEDRIMIEVQETTTWKKRFAANETRRKKGLPVLSPAEYIGAESSFRQIMQQAGLPPGFYDQPDDFQKFLENDVSPQEIQSRVQSAQSIVEAADPATRQAFEKWYTKGDIVAYALDPKRTEAVLARQAAAAALGGEALSSGFGGSFTVGQAEQLAGMGMSQGQAQQGFNQARRLSDVFSRLSNVYAGDAYGDEEAVAETFFDDNSASAISRRLASQERAAFSGRSGLGATSLSQDSGGGL